MNIKKINIEQIFNQFTLLYRQSVIGMNVVINSYCNSYMANTWAISLFQKVYKIEEIKNMDIIDYQIFCLYNNSLYKQIKKIFKMNEYEYNNYHHYSKSKYINCEEFTIILSEKTESIFWVYGKKLYIVSSGEKIDSILEFSRVIREVLTQKAEQKGFILLHASAVEKNGEVFLITGEKGAGKTTSLINLVKLGYNIVSNDRLFLYVKQNELYCITWPGCVAISVNTLYREVKFGYAIKSLRYLAYPQQRLKSIDKFVNDYSKYSNKNPNDKFDLSCEEFATLFDVKYIPCGKVSKIINIYYDKKVQIQNNFLYPIDKSYPNWLLLNKDSFNDNSSPFLEVKKIMNNKIVDLKLEHNSDDTNKILKLIEKYN